MNLIIHPQTGGPVAEFVADTLLLQKEQDPISLIEELFASRASKIILHQANIAPQFFDLRSGLAGAVLQKFVNYSIRVAIIGDFSNFSSRALQAFIYESNRGSQVFFLESVEKALEKFAVVQSGA